MMMKKRIIVLLTCAFALCILIATASFVSIRTVSVDNPFAAAWGMGKLLLTDAEYVEIQVYPRVIVARPDVSLDQLMEQEKLTRDESQQMGSIHVFTNGEYSEYIRVSQNRFFAKWRWQE